MPLFVKSEQIVENQSLTALNSSIEFTKASTGSNRVQVPQLQILYTGVLVLAPHFAIGDELTRGEVYAPVLYGNGKLQDFRNLTQNGFKVELAASVTPNVWEDLSGSSLKGVDCTYPATYPQQEPGGGPDTWDIIRLSVKVAAHEARLIRLAYQVNVLVKGSANNDGHPEELFDFYRTGSDQRVVKPDFTVTPIEGEWQCEHYG